MDPSKPRPLTPKQLAFAEAIAGGQNVSEAYVTAGYKSDPYKNANQIAGNRGVIAKIAELRAENKTLTKWTKARKMAILQELGDDTKNRASERIAAIKEHNVMTGDHEPQRVINEDGPEKIKSARERALAIASPLNRLASKK